MNLRMASLTLAISATSLLLPFSQAQSAVTWQFNFTDVGVGFNDPTHGAARQAALIAAGNKVSSYLSPTYNAVIKMDVNGAVTGNSTLAAAGSSFNSPRQDAFGNKGDVMIKILGGADPNPGAADGSVTWNFDGFQWELGNDFQAGEFDFHSTAVHELIHTIGFSSDILQNGSDPWGNAAGSVGSWSPFDEFVADSSGALIDGSYVLDKARWDKASLGGAGTVPVSPDSGLYFIGANAMAANGGNPVPLYSPATWSDGSSLSHTDDAFFNGMGADTLMMNSASDSGPSNRDLSPIELGMLKDMGYSVVPVPAAVWLMGSGLLALFGFSRRKQAA